MKKIVVFVLLFVVSYQLISCEKVKTITDPDTLIRIHIRANSNSESDQNIKLKVRDELVVDLGGYLSFANNCDDAKAILATKLYEIEREANKILRSNNFCYTAKASLRKEYFPARQYNELLLCSGVYSSLIVELGEGTGDNWWCVAYPPLCFVGSDDKVEYSSLLAEWWGKLVG